MTTKYSDIKNKQAFWACCIPLILVLLMIIIYITLKTLPISLITSNTSEMGWTLGTFILIAGGIAIPVGLFGDNKIG